MTNNLDFLGSEEKNAPGDLSKLKSMIDSMQSLESEIDKLEESLKIKKEAFRKINQEDIPFFLRENGLSEIKLQDGKKVNVKENISVTIKDNNNFLSWLKNRNEDDISKYTVNFDRMESEDIKIINSFLTQNGYNYKGENKVHPMTLKKYFRELLGIGKEPAEIKAGLNNKKIVSRETIEEFAKVFTYFTTKIK
jgi:hypothetical protein